MIVIPLLYECFAWYLGYKYAIGYDLNLAQKLGYKYVNSD